jgi:hypothetical protein
VLSSAKGEAPEGLHTTGDAVFNKMWTLLHAPNIGVPVCFGSNGIRLHQTLADEIGERGLRNVDCVAAPVHRHQFGGVIVKRGYRRVDRYVPVGFEISP